ncbi:Phospholipid phosphatase-related protein type 1 [Nymphon striatum]|nr:Phospholipid phosphatase-related protein type 1 [Nymphon striatum]
MGPFLGLFLSQNATNYSFLGYIFVGSVVTSSRKSSKMDGEDMPDVTADADVRSEKVYKVSHLIIPVFLLETMVALALAVLAYQLRFTDIFPTSESGFFIGDPNLNYPYKAQENQKYNLFLLGSFLIVPAIVLIIGEVGLWLFSTNPRKLVRASCVPCKINLLPRRLIRFSGTFILGLIISTILVDSLKLLFNTHRPYFLDICRPNVTEKGVYVTAENVCTNMDRTAVKKARLSFPSFHSALSGYSAVFTMVYLHYVASMRGTVVFRPVIIFTIAGASLFSAISRYTSHINHWQDVLVGYIIGTLVSLYLAIGILHKFCEHEDRSSSPDCVDDNVRNEYNANLLLSCWCKQEMYVPQLLPWQWIPRPVYSGKKGIEVIQERNKIMSKRRKKDGNSDGPSSAFQKDLHRRLENFSHISHQMNV